MYIYRRYKAAPEEYVGLQVLKRYITGGWQDSREVIEAGAEKN